MKFRYARHTNNLELITDFYMNVLGFQKLGEFENHSNYNGVFLGKDYLDWHLEFTESDEKTTSKPDADDLLVFYFQTSTQINVILEKAKEKGIFPEDSKNPYWEQNGIELKDPDGFGVMLTYEK